MEPQPPNEKERKGIGWNSVLILCSCVGLLLATHGAAWERTMGVIITIVAALIQITRAALGPAQTNRSKAIGILCLLAILSLPILRDTFAGHRYSWLLLLAVLAAVAFLLDTTLTWLLRKMLPLRGSAIRD